MKRPALLLVPAAIIATLLTFASVAWAARADTVRFSSWPESFHMANGQPIHRFTLTPDNTTAESNLTASGGTAVAYTLFGGERICLQAITTDAYIEFIAAASVTAAGAKGFTITAGQPLDTNCFTLTAGTLSVSALCTAAGPCLVKGFEKL
jgi:hypothetical protein